MEKQEQSNSFQRPGSYFLSGDDAKGRSFNHDDREMDRVADPYHEDEISQSAHDSSESEDEDRCHVEKKRRFRSVSSTSDSPSPKVSLTPQSSASEADNFDSHSPPLPGNSTINMRYGTKRLATTNKDMEDGEDDGWKELPEILLEDIFVLLTPKQRHQASMVCRPWYRIFYSPHVWETFVLLERTLTKRRFNLYKGYQRELCPRKTQVCLMRVGCFFKRIVVTPISDYYNLYEFLRVLAAFLAFYKDFPMPLLHTFRFTFACESRGMTGLVIHGTGGKILDELKQRWWWRCLRYLFTSSLELALIISSKDVF